MSTTTARSSYDYDYLVIGGGSGGVSSAKRAAQLYGMKVGIIESSRWGGTCVNVGCVPKKIMYQASQIYETINHHSSHYEMMMNMNNDTTTTTTTTTGDEKKKSIQAKLNWNAMKLKRDKYITRLNGIYLNGLKKLGVDVYEGYGSFVDEHTVSVKMIKEGTTETTKTITSDKILIAVGGKPWILDKPGIEHTITSDGFFELEYQPTKAVVVGAGYIAVELAGVLNGLGTETHLVVRKERALRNFDPDISEFLDKEMIKSGIQIHRNTNGIEKIELSSTADNNGNKKKIVTCLNGDVITDVDIVLMAPGRIPNVDGLNLSAAGVTQKDPNINNSIILVDEYQNTNVANIFALGDVCGQVELTPMAIAAGRRLSDRLFGPSNIYEKAKTSYENVPTVVFSHPTIGTIGYTEPEAISIYGKDNIKIYKSTFVNLYYSIFDMEPSNKPRTYMKIICYGEREQVIGLHMIGLSVDEILQGFGVSMKMGMTKADLDSCIAIHPTAAEEMVTMGTWGTSPQYTGASISPLMGNTTIPKPNGKL